MYDSWRPAFSLSAAISEAIRSTTASSLEYSSKREWRHAATSSSIERAASAPDSGRRGGSCADMNVERSHGSEISRYLALRMASSRKPCLRKKPTAFRSAHAIAASGRAPLASPRSSASSSRPPTPSRWYRTRTPSRLTCSRHCPSRWPTSKLTAPTSRCVVGASGGAAAAAAAASSSSDELSSASASSAASASSSATLSPSGSSRSSVAAREQFARVVGRDAGQNVLVELDDRRVHAGERVDVGGRRELLGDERALRHFCAASAKFAACERAISLRSQLDRSPPSKKAARRPLTPPAPPRAASPRA